MNYNNKTFKSITASENAEVTSKTLFIYKQVGNVLTANYKGGQIIEGHLIGLVANNGDLNMRYHQINTKGELMTGICHSKPEILQNGKIRLHETWQWTSGNLSKGTSVLEEI